MQRKARVHLFATQRSALLIASACALALMQACDDPHAPEGPPAAHLPHTPQLPPTPDSGAQDAGAVRPHLVWRDRTDDEVGPVRDLVAIGNNAGHVFAGGFLGGGTMYQVAGHGAPL